MVRALFLLLAIAALACGGEAPESGDSAASRTSGDDDNSAPVISSIELVPESPGVGDVLSVAVRAIDPDGDRVEVEVDWYRNGSLEQSGTQTRLATTDFRRGDRVWAEVWISDGDLDVEKRTATVSFSNQLPEVLALRLAPPNATGSDTLMVVSNVVDHDQDPYELQYRWYANGELLADVTGASLPPGHVSRGDTVEVEIAGVDSAGTGEWVRSPGLEIRNSPPVFTSLPADATVGNGSYLYQLQANDPDGDRPLRFSLIEGPRGLQVDLVTGSIRWAVPDNVGGQIPIKVAVADPHGAQAEQRYVLNLSWATTPSSADRSAPEDESEDDADEGDEDSDDDSSDDFDDEEDADDAADEAEDEDQAAEYVDEEDAEE